ncbi:hypothetical protein CsSME_00017020 [Camellia sinensis var. sinensis]
MFNAGLTLYKLFKSHHFQFLRSIIIFFRDIPKHSLSLSL